MAELETTITKVVHVVIIRTDIKVMPLSIIVRTDQTSGVMANDDWGKL